MRLSWIWLAFLFGLVVSADPYWTWECTNNNCQKSRFDAGLTNNTLTSLGVCQLLCCKHASLWPKPTGNVTIGEDLVSVDLENIDFTGVRSENVINTLLIPAGVKIFIDNLKRRLTNRQRSRGKTLTVSLKIARPEVDKLQLNMDESYQLSVEKTGENLEAVIKADNYFGGRHGLETLGQLIVYDEINGEFKMPSRVSITDGPVYTYRGVLLDTARNFISVEVIKKTLDGMSASKLNTFHWHLTDSQSFPYVSQSHPELSQIGAYSSDKVYTQQDVAEIVQYGQERGIRILPEFDAPAHVGEGWQGTDFVACFNKQPWMDYCVEPPCGQFDPTKDGLYDYLEDIYNDIIKQFNPDIFHMGGDEVSFSCWNSTSSIKKWMRLKGWGTSEQDFVKLWGHFQRNALERFDRKSGENKLKIVLWSTTLTKKEYAEKYLPKDRYIVQIWTSGEDEQIVDLLKMGYKLILSNYDALYLDCGFGGWVNDGSSWCSPYKTWQKIYENSPAKIGGEYAEQFLGAEAALWTEQADDSSVDGRIWPRAAAMAERLWSEPETGWMEAEQRFLIHRQRLVARGIRAEALQPQWCLQHQQNCPANPLY